MPIFGHKQRLVLNKTVKQVSTNSVNPSSPQSRVLRNIFTFNSSVVTTITMSHLTLHKVTGALLFLPNINILCHGKPGSNDKGESRQSCVSGLFALKRARRTHT